MELYRNQESEEISTIMFSEIEKAMKDLKRGNISGKGEIRDDCSKILTRRITNYPSKQISRELINSRHKTKPWIKEMNTIKNYI